MGKTSLPAKGGIIAMDKNLVGADQPVDTASAILMASNLNHLADSVPGVYACHLFASSANFIISGSAAQGNVWLSTFSLRNIPAYLPVNPDGTSQRIRPLLQASPNGLTNATAVTVKMVVSNAINSYPSLDSANSAIATWSYGAADAFAWSAPTSGNSYIEVTDVAVNFAERFGVGSPDLLGTSDVETNVMSQVYISVFAKSQNNAAFDVEVRGLYAAGYGGG